MVSTLLTSLLAYVVLIAGSIGLLLVAFAIAVVADKWWQELRQLAADRRRATAHAARMADQQRRIQVVTTDLIADRARASRQLAAVAHALEIRPHRRE
ncbi:MAG: hypothetical protein WDA07_10940 [Leucobacter sp.]